MIRPRDDVERNAAEEETLQLFQVNVDDEEDEDVPSGHPRPYAHVQSPSVSRLSSLDQDDEGDSRPRIIGFGNARARISKIDIIAPSSPPSVAHFEGNGVMSTSGSARKLVHDLSAQAGAIIVRDHLLCSDLVTRAHTHTLFFFFPRMYTPSYRSSRAFTTCLSSFLSSS